MQRCKDATCPVCPLCHSSDNIVLKKTIPVWAVIEKYQTHFNTDVRQILQLEYLQLYECLSTGYQFFYPFNLEGDTAFYTQLSKLSWYYMAWKWEHEIAMDHISANQTVLEIGCAEGSFLHAVKHRLNGLVTGIELNETAARVAQQKGLTVYSHPLCNHARDHQNTYDIICAFQVIEHVAAIREFVDDVLTALKAGGRFIVSVPNQDAFIGLDDSNVLDMPPHHLGKWNERALKNLTKIFPVRLLAIEFEPLQDYHFKYFATVVRKTLQNDYQLHDKLINAAQKQPDQIRGHTVLAVFEKMRI